MSAGLMSCVRENSPPLEMDGEIIATSNNNNGSGDSLTTDIPETQKRRRFLHPLRNLRRIFRRRTVTHADTVSVTSTDKSCDLHNNELINSCGPSSLSIKQSQQFIEKEKREHSADGLRQKVITDNEIDRDMTDYQRSFSEGRLVDSEFDRDPLSQSHDSVFSESATASSLSIVLKAELVDALRKRRPRPDASDEDLGLPRSPTTPQKKHRSTMMNQSEGSLSLLSIISSDMDEDSTFGAGNSSNYSKNSSDMSRNLDDVDLDLSVGSKLSHSAARHKMAIRPKKKGPTRNRRTHDASILPSTPEVNEDFSKISNEVETVVSSTFSSMVITSTSINSTKIKSQSLPPGVNAKILDKHSTSKLMLPNEKVITSTSSIYVNKNISKSYDFDKDSVNSSPTTTLDRKDEDGFFKRLLNRSTKKKKISDNVKVHNDDTPDSSTGSNISNSNNNNNNKVIVSISPMVTSENDLQENLIKPSIIHGKIPRSGAASRQRVIPQDLPSNLPPKSPKKLSPTSTEIKSSFDYNNTTTTILTTSSTESLEIPKINKKSINNEEIVSSLSPPKSIWPNNNIIVETNELPSKFKTPKIYGLSPFQQRISGIVDETNDKRRKPVEKSKSFRFYNETVSSSQNLSNSNNLPSLPDLTSNYHSNSSGIENEQQFFSIQNPPIKFDVSSDNNLTQIEENIDKIVKSSYVCMKKSTRSSTEIHTNSMISSSGDESENVKEEKSRRNSTLLIETSVKSDVPEFMKIQLNRVDSTRPKSHVVLSKNVKEVENKEIVRRFSNENVEISENKPPLPPDVRRNSINKSQENITLIETMNKTQPIRKLSHDSRKSSISDDGIIDNNRLYEKNKIDDNNKPMVISSIKRVSIDENILKNNRNSETRKSISDDENVVVVMRKKSISTNKDDTPELMKVFARRSLKIKDNDDFTVFQENLNNNNNNINNNSSDNKPSNLDSDKENQSSSEEKLDKLPKVEITIANGNANNNNINNNNNNINNNNNNNNINLINEKREIPTKKIIENSGNVEIFRKSNSITPKPFVSSNRFANVSNFRNTTTFIDVRKNLNTSSKDLEKSNNNENIINSNNNNNNNNNIVNNRHTINVSSLKTDENDLTNERMEFKNIHQRRAEWEKRAKEGH